MKIIFTHIWALFILGTIINAMIWKVRSARYIAEKPELKKPYRRVIVGSLIFGSLPWLIMGTGMLTGMTDNFIEYIFPRKFSPIIIVYISYTLLSWILGTYWIIFRNGADQLASLPGLFYKKGLTGPKIARKVKLIWLASIAGGVAAFIILWTFDIKVNY